MKKKKLIVLAASLGLLLAACGNQGGGNTSTSTSEGPTSTTSSEEIPSSSSEEVPPVVSSSSSEEEVIINHQDPFVTTVENPSTIRAFNENFDTMLEDFSGETPNGTTTGVFNKSFLRVLVDSNDTNEPTTPDAAIYKMATGSYEIQNYEGIGFKIRKVGDGVLPLSNLVLGLRGDDAFKVFPINLEEALDADGEALPELSNEFQDLVIAPGQSIEDANTLYELATGGDSTTKVLDKILGFHLYALGEECSAVVEIEEVYLINAGEKAILDTFARSNVGATDTTCWWRGSTGFIVQKGVTLNKAKYELEDDEILNYDYVALNILGDTSGLKVNNVPYANLKDDLGNVLTGAVNGAFYSYVIDLEASNALDDNKLVLESTTEVVVSQIFATDLIDELPAEDYPYVDFANVSYITDFNFNISKGTVKDNYDDAVLDTRVTDAGLNYVISYNHKETIEIADGHLSLSPIEDYSNLVIGSNADVNKDYLVLAMKYNEVPTGLRIKLGNSSIVYAGDWLADAGLASFPEYPSNYPYVTADGYQLIIIDLARSGFDNINNEITLWYTGGEEILIDSIFFADEYVPALEVVEHESFDFEKAGGDVNYDYVGAVNVAGYSAVKIETTATVANELRFGLGGDAVYMNTGNIIDIYGESVADGSKEFTIDLEASNIVLDGDFMHIHSTRSEAGFTMKVTLIEVLEPYDTRETGLFYSTREGGDVDYDYVGAANVEGYDFIKVYTTATPANELRFGLGEDAVYMNSGNIIDIFGNVVEDGATEFTIDLVASGIVLDGDFMHIHSTKSEDGFEISVYGLEILPRIDIKEGGKTTYNKIGGDVNYDYVGAVNVAGYSAVKIETTATVANELRFGLGEDAVYMNTGNIIDIYGNVVEDGATEFTIDLVASGIVLDGDFMHIHSTRSEAGFEMEVTPLSVNVVGSYGYLLAQYVG